MQITIKREKQNADGFRFAVVVSRWNEELTSRLLAGALASLAEAGADSTAVEVFKVPGAFELPVAALKAAETKRFDVIIALGVVIRGETPHFDFVAGEAAAGILRVSLDTGIPVMFGVVTADTPEQAAARSGDGPENKGFEAAAAAVEMANLFAAMKLSTGAAHIGKRVFPNVA